MTQIVPLVAFDQFIATYRRMAEARDLSWSMSYEAGGRVSKVHRWDLCELTGTPKPPAFYLSDLGTDQPALHILNRERVGAGLPELPAKALSPAWQDLLKAMTIRALFEQRNGARHTFIGVVRPIRALATCCHDKEPWKITAEDVRGALQIIGRVDRNAKLRSLVEAQVVTLDDNGLSYSCPLLGARSAGPRRVTKRLPEIRRNLEERRRADRLPGTSEFWEMLRILLEETPETFYDAIRFAAVELGMLLGLRVEETATIPVDPIVLKHYVDIRGESTAKRGGVGHTMFLRHFSEKQGLRSASSVVYAETSTSVLRMFENEIRDIVERITMMTAPLRARLEAQVRSGRIFPEFEPQQIVPLSEIYPRLTGNPLVYDCPRNGKLVKQYRATLRPSVLEKIKLDQAQVGRDGGKFSETFRVYFARPENSWIPKVDLESGQPARKGARLVTVGVHIGTLEVAVRESIGTKLSDAESFPLDGARELGIYDCLFLVPKRALGEGRNGGVCDVTRYAFVGRLTSTDINMALGTERQASQGFFTKYGRPEAASYTMNFHAMRHMHNNELFAAGVADTIITHRFGRKSVAQSHEYDSRTLAQELADMDLPPGSADLLNGPARDAFKLIMSNRGQGPIVEEFRRIQKAEGDEAAIVFLATEADGMQITPYGLCLNSFVVEPCPRHLECFSGCCYLMRTGQAAETAQLQKLAERYRTLLEAIGSHPGSEAAKANARSQAESRIAAIEKALETKPGEFVFPEGADLSRPQRDVPMVGLIE